MARADSGWVKLHRKILDSDIGHNYTLLGLWVTLIKWANWKDSTVKWRGLPRVLERGEILTSVKELANFGEIDRRTVDRWLKYLEVRQSISVTKAPKGSQEGIIIKVLNYQKYNSLDALWPNEHVSEHVNEHANEHVNEHVNEGRTYKELNNKRTKEVTSPWAEILLRIWNENRGPLPKALALNVPRTKAANQRFKEFPEEQFWIDVVTRLAESDFCTGRNDRGWKADFDFFLRPTTHLAVNEGKYDNKKGAANTLGVMGA